MGGAPTITPETGMTTLMGLKQSHLADYLQNAGNQLYNWGQGQYNTFTLPYLNWESQAFGGPTVSAPGVTGVAEGAGPTQVGTLPGMRHTPVWDVGGQLMTGGKLTNGQYAGGTVLPMGQIGGIQWGPGYGYSTGTTTPGDPNAPMTPFTNRLFQLPVNTASAQAAQAKNQIAQMSTLGPAAQAQQTAQVDLNKMNNLSNSIMQSMMGMLPQLISGGTSANNLGTSAYGSLQGLGAQTLAGASQSFSIGEQLQMQADLANQKAAMSGNTGLMSMLKTLGGIGSMIGSSGGVTQGAGQIFGKSGGGLGGAVGSGGGGGGIADSSTMGGYNIGAWGGAPISSGSGASLAAMAI